jgi:integrase
MSAFQQPKGSGKWRAKFELNGETIWVPGSPFATKQKAKEAEQRHRERIGRRRTTQTCHDFSFRWLEEWPRPAVSTNRHYAIAMRRFREAFGDELLGEVERADARTWALGVPRNVSKACGTMYQDAMNVGLVTLNPFANLRLPATEKTAEVAPPSLEEFRQLVNACTIHGGYAAEIRALITFTAWTGLRAAEVAGLEWEDVGDEYILVRRAEKSDGTFGMPKSGKEREIVYFQAARVLDQVPRRAGSRKVFHSLTGEDLNKGNLYNAWKAVRDNSGTTMGRADADIKPLRFHDLRHFCATQLLERGNSHSDVAIQLGHQDGGQLVMARYGHPDEDAARARLRANDAGFAAEIGSSTTAEVGR